MNFVNGEEYTGKDGVVGTWNSQTGCFHVVQDGVSVKYTAQEFGLEDQVPEVTTTEE